MDPWLADIVHQGTIFVIDTHVAFLDPVKSRYNASKANHKAKKQGYKSDHYSGQRYILKKAIERWATLLLGLL